MHYAPRNLSRRHFLHATGAGIGLLALSGLESQAGANSDSFASRGRNLILLSMPAPLGMDELYPHVSQHKQDLLEGLVPSVELADAQQDSTSCVTLFDTLPSNAFALGAGGLRLRDAGKPVLESLKPFSIADVNGDFRHQAAVFEAADVDREAAPISDLYGMDDDDRRMASFGRKCLIARRLVERDVPFVQIWAPAATAGGISAAATAQDQARWTDRPIAALLTDLRQRGMLDSTLVIWANVAASAPLNA